MGLQLQKDRCDQVMHELCDKRYSLLRKQGYNSFLVHVDRNSWKLNRCIDVVRGNVKITYYPDECCVKVNVTGEWLGIKIPEKWRGLSSVYVLFPIKSVHNTEEYYQFLKDFAEVNPRK